MPLPVLTGVVFDMDGTLTIPNLDFAKMYERCGVCISDDLLAEVAAMPEESRRAATSVIEDMEAEGRRTLALAPGAVELAQWLGAHGVPTALVTRNTAATVDALAVDLWAPAGLPPFSRTVSRDSDPGLPAKPHPAALNAIAAGWGRSLPAPGLLMVGDSPANDVAFGRAAGVATALVDSGRRFAEGGADGGADVRVDCLVRLPRELWRRFRIAGALGTDAPLAKHAAPAPASPASQAAARGDAVALAALAAADPGALVAADSASGGFAGNTPLIWAAEGGSVEAVAVVLAACAALNAAAGCTAATGSSGRLFLNHQGFLGATAVSRAARRGHADCLAALLAAGADPDLANVKLQAPLHFAAFKRHPACAAALLAAGASPLALDRKGRTPGQDTADPALAATLAEAEEARIAQVAGFLREI